MNQYDPITLEIIQSSLQAAADEMFGALRREVGKVMGLSEDVTSALAGIVALLFAAHWTASAADYEEYTRLQNRAIELFDRVRAMTWSMRWSTR